ncbi:MAG: triose-phosphate isomerase [Bacteroidales bacterium]|nr:triose-phosphate isomerase [Bacteroidales bacterium]
MRKKIIAGNWKMNMSFDEAEDLLFNIVDKLDPNLPKNIEVVVCPPAIFMELATDVADDSLMKIGGQNISNHESGAYTGEISASMLGSLEVDYCIIGHSERRKYFKESNQLIGEKVTVALKNGIKAIFCCGELLNEREAQNHFAIVKTQIEEALFHLDEKSFRSVVIAYEPVWAIGTGVNATPQQAQEMHAYIRKLISGKYGAEIADITTILYGGSCNSQNAKELFANPDVDGGLIGGASLDAEEFLKIINSI